jgi:hypothetical protein
MNPLIYGDGSKVDPAFKAIVADICRSEAASLTREQRHAEAAAKIAAAERLERQVAEETRTVEHA